MKKNYILTIVLAFSLSFGFAQVTTVLNGVPGASGLLVNGNDLYIVEYNSSVVSRIDYTQSTPTKSTLVSGLVTPSEIALNGDDLFVSEFTVGRISRFDLSQSNPTRTTFISGMSQPTGLAVYGDFLYVVDSITNILYRVDLNSSNPSLETVLSGLLRPIGLNIFGDELYIAEDNGDRVSKIDLTVSNPTRVTVATGIDGAFDMTFSPNGNYMYTVASDGGAITETDITTIPNSSSTILQSGFNFPTRVQAIGDELYASIFSENRLIKFSVATLGVNDNSLDNTISLFPNPSSDFVTINSQQTLENFAIYDVLGKKVSEGQFENSDYTLPVSDLENGQYFIKINNKQTISFIKK